MRSDFGGQASSKGGKKLQVNEFLQFIVNIWDPKQCKEDMVPIGTTQVNSQLVYCVQLILG